MKTEPHNEQPQPNIYSLVEQGVACLKQRQPLDYDELCRACPELRPEVERRIAQQLKFEIIDTPPDAGETPNLVNNTAPEAIPPAPPGYEILSELGRGGMGIVYRARDLAFDRDVALKVLKSKNAEMSRFVAEARITGQLQHPGIPAAYEVGTLADGRPFLAMKIIQGKTLEKLIQSGEKIDTLAIFEDIAQAVGYAHGQNVIHRDLKPANIMVGSFGEVQVMDWGLAKVLHQTNDAEPEPADVRPYSPTAATPVITADGWLLGTPAYMSPEQARGELTKLDARTDVFNLGLILCELITGKRPYASKNAVVMLLDAQEGKTEAALTQLDNSTADPGVIALCKRCLALAPEDRPNTAAEVAIEIATLRAAADDRVKQAEKAKLKAKAMQWAGGAVTAVLLLGIIGTSLGLIRANIARSVAETAEKTADEKRAEAETEKKRAIEFRDKALDALRATTGEDVEKLIGEKKELTANEKAYLEAIAKRWQVFAEQEGDDEQSQAIRAEGYFKVANIRYKFGQFDNASNDYLRSLQFQESLVNTFPSNPAHRSNLALCRINYGNLLSDMGKKTDASQQYEESINLCKILTVNYPNKLNYLHSLAKSTSNLAYLVSEIGDIDRTINLYRESSDIYTELSQLDANNPTYQRDLALNYINFGRFYSSQGMHSSAQEKYNYALSAINALSTEYPDIIDYKCLIAKCHNNLGSLFVAIGKHSQAEYHFLESIKIQEKLANDSPLIQDFKVDLANSHSNLSVCLVYQSKSGKAESHDRKSLAIREQLAKDNPLVPDFRSALASSHINLANVLRQLGRIKESEDNCISAINIQEKLTGDYPSISGYFIVCGVSYLNLGQTLFIGKKPLDSLVWFDKGISVFRKVLDAEDGNKTAQKYLRLCYINRAKSYDHIKEYSKAADDWGVAVSLCDDSRLPFIRFALAQSNLKAGKITSAIADLADLANLNVWETDDWYDFACVYAVASGKVADKKQEYADRAMELLTKAIAAGYADVEHIKSDTDLDALRDRGDLKKLVAELEAKQPKK